MIQTGCINGVTWNGTTVAITDYDYEDTGDLYDATNTGTQAQQALIAGIQRGGGTFKMWFDTSAAPQALGLRFGVKGKIGFINGGTPYAIPVSIEKVGVRSVVNGLIGVEVSAKYDFFAL